MGIEVETAEIAIDTAGAEAVEQTLDALGVQAEGVNAAADTTPAVEGRNPRQEPVQAAAADGPDLSELVAEQRRTNALLERLIELTEQHQHNAPTY